MAFRAGAAAGCVRVDSAPSGGAIVVARDWPLAALAGAALLVPGLAVLGWSIAGGHPVEGGGAVVLAGLGAFAVRLGMAHRRTLTIVRETSDGGDRGDGGDGGNDGHGHGACLRVSGSEGAGPWRRPVDVRLGRAAAPRVHELPLVDGAALGGIADRGADLVLTDGVVTVPLARGIGARGRTQVAAACEALALRI